MFNYTKSLEPVVTHFTKHSAVYKIPGALAGKTLGSQCYSRINKLLPGTTKSRFKLSDRYHGLEDNVWLKIFPGAGSSDYVNLGLGFPNYQSAPEIVAHLAQASHWKASYQNHQYTRINGHARLVNALATFYGSLLQRDIDPMKEILVTPGATGALNYAILSHIMPGDEVIIIEPFFDPYVSWVKAAGGIPVYVPLRYEPAHGPLTASNWKLDMSEFKSKFNKKTKAIILNTPNNPLGKVFTSEELTKIGRVCRNFDVLIIADEVYEWYIYDDNEHVRICTLEDFWDRTITIGSAGKTFSLTGWKLGWAYGPEHLIQNMSVVHFNTNIVCQTPEQEAIAAALEVEIENLNGPEAFFLRTKAELEDKRYRVLKAIRSSGMEPIIPDGGYLVTTKWNFPDTNVDLSNEQQGRRDFQFCKWLVREKKLMGVPTSVFYSEPHKSLGEDFVRFNFYISEDTIDKATEILKNLNLTSDNNNATTLLPPVELKVKQDI